MSDSYLGEIRMFAGSYAPEGWALCNGALLSVSEYEALYTLIGTTYGGDGRTTFGVPDLRGRIPIGQGQAPNLSAYVLGAKLGAETATVSESQIPSHTHTVNVVATAATTSTPSSAVSLAATTAPAGNYTVTLPSPAAPRNLDASTIGNSGAPGPPPHPNVMPSFTVNFIIAVTGVYPVRP